MHRRNFIILSTLTAAITSVPFVNCTNHVTELDKTLSLPKTLSQLLDVNTMKQAGKAYGKLKPDEYDVKILEQQLLKNKTADEVKDVYATLEKSVQQDFDSGSTMVLNGWVLSITEARQCALFSLISK